ncbi:hypothetical protein CGC50_02885 [Capnocytophaga gingivalis]|jgi:hypothetical protein|uniref:GmrSD restriction endonucleases N-terminal domain-containing protein n=1 Tax=Capnocytophaga gingivalis TaxID=1017 RepID=A0A250FM39_9FLAO|nr:DUF262 domain-containing protein [Capnocytophaga gingivalis]ATA86190.1 hypothetical protein CGC50_02885 [Capnocytophaga gingivalis]
MALSLTAEQKSLSDILSKREQIIIPPYQRPYSWGIEECYQLYQDFLDAYNSDSDYFIGNIILAVSENEKKLPRIIDGQQRIITIWLIFKVLSTFYEDLRILKDMTRTYEWDGNQSKIKIKSDVIESKDYQDLEIVFNWGLSDFSDNLKECQTKTGIFFRPTNLSPIKVNGLYFFYLFKEFEEKEEINKLKFFIRFMLERIYLLPIELSDTTIDSAENKALTIFETINNRGMDLQDADIFKAKLYAKAISESEKDNFIKLWFHFRDECESIKLSVDEIFRYYSHIIRGRDGNTKNEISIREFFTGSNSPISRNTQNETMTDLLKITLLLKKYDEKKKEETELAAWLQLIDIYSNRYPKYAIITYLFKYGFSEEIELIHVLKSVVRYCYFKGSTSSIKFGIYIIIKQISSGERIKDYYQDDVDSDQFNYLGRLKYGYALLAHYLENPICIPDYKTDRLLTLRDEDNLSEDWNNHPLSTHIDDLGNLVILDIHKKNEKYSDKIDYYLNTKNEELKKFLINNRDGISYAALQKRTKYKKQLLVNFFNLHTNNITYEKN